MEGIPQSNMSTSDKESMPLTSRQTSALLDLIYAKRSVRQAKINHVKFKTVRDSDFYKFPGPTRGFDLTGEVKDRAHAVEVAKQATSKDAKAISAVFSEGDRVDLEKLESYHSELRLWAAELSKPVADLVKVGGLNTTMVEQERRANPKQIQSVEEQLKKLASKLDGLAPQLATVWTPENDDEDHKALVAEHRALKAQNGKQNSAIAHTRADISARRAALTSTQVRLNAREVDTAQLEVVGQTAARTVCEAIPQVSNESHAALKRSVEGGYRDLQDWLYEQPSVKAVVGKVGGGAQGSGN